MALKVDAGAWGETNRGDSRISRAGGEMLKRIIWQFATLWRLPGEVIREAVLEKS